MNEERNEKEMTINNKNEVSKEMEEGTPISHEKVGVLNEVRNVTFSIMLGRLLQVGM
jgi:hypothetical protein